MTKIYCDSSTRMACLVIDGQEAMLMPYPEQVTNNVGEYKAVILALKEAKRLKLKQVMLLTDSLLVVNQVSGIWKCRHKHLLPFILHVRQLKEEVDAQLEWIPREENLAGLVLE